MKYFQINFLLPITVLDYNIAEKYVTLKIDEEISQKNDDEYIEFPNLSGASFSAFSTSMAKKYCLTSSLPMSIKEILDHQGLIILETKAGTFPKTITQYTSPNIPGLSVTIHSHCSIGDSMLNNPFNANLDSSEYEFEDYDLLNPKFSDQKLYSAFDINEIKENFGIAHEQDWRLETNPLITVYKLIAIDVKYLEIKIDVENLVKSIIRDYMIYFHKTALTTHHIWYKLGGEQIKNSENELRYRNNLYKKKTDNKPYEYVLETTKDFLTATRFKKALEQQENLVISTVKYDKYPNENINNNHVQKLSVSMYETLNEPTKIRSIQKPKEIKKIGTIYKRGDGPIDFGWNARYFVLDGNTLIYYQNATEKTPKGLTKLIGATVSIITSIEDRVHVFIVDIPYLERKFVLSCDTREETEEWRQAILLASSPEPFTESQKGDHLLNSLSNTTKKPFEKQFLEDSYPSQNNTRRVSLQQQSNSKDLLNITSDKRNSIIIPNIQADNMLGKLNQKHSLSAPLQFNKNINYTPPIRPIISHQLTEDIIDEEYMNNVDNEIKPKMLYHSKTNSFSVSSPKASLDSKNKKKTMGKKAKTIYNYCVENIPKDLLPIAVNLEKVANNIPSDWKTLKTKDGIKYYVREIKDFMTLSSGTKAFPVQSYAKYGLLALIFFLYIIKDQQFFIKSILFGLIICLCVFHFMSILNKTNEAEEIGKVLIDEDALNVFYKIKKISLRKKWDLGISDITKTKREPNQPKTESKLQIIYNIPKNEWINDKGLKTIKCDVQRKAFIISDDMFFIFEIVNMNNIPMINQQNQKKGFILKECFLIQKYAKISGKSMVYFYSKLDTDIMSIFQSITMQKNRFKNLAVIRDFLAEERLKDVVEDLNSSADEAEIKQIQHSPTLMEKFSESPLITSPMRRGISFQVANPLENMTKSQFQTKKTIMEEIHSVSTEKAPLFDDSKITDFSLTIKLIEDMKNGLTINTKPKTYEERYPGYKRIKSGGIECQNQEELKCQEGIVMELVRTAGKQILEGKNIVGLSLPVRIFEPRSHIERICDLWAFGPIYLNMAAESNDPVERMKYVITFALSGLYLGCKQLKPFNPILGETFQAFWSDGSAIYCEHISHHPPISSFMYTDVKDRYKYTGYYEYKGGVKGNSVVYIQEGPNRVQFKDGQSIIYNLPSVKLSGLLYGSRTVEWNGNLTFKDESNDIIGKLVFYENNNIFSKNLHPSDYFEGTIAKISDPTTILSKLKGSWTSFIEFDGKRYWDLEYIEPAQIIKTNQPLPSDSRFREDLIYLGRKDLVKAQEKKIGLEVIQRGDRKLRNEYKEKFLKGKLTMQKSML